MPDAKPMAAQLGSTARRSRTLRRTEAKIGTPRIARTRISKPTGTHGSGNWRKSSGRRLSTASGQTGLHPEAEQQENATSGDRDMDFIMHLVQLGFGDGEAMRDELATQSRSL